MVAVWQRYPNPFSRHVLSEDAIFRRVEGPFLYTKRLLLKTNPLPKWGQIFVHARHVAIVEESVLDRDSQVLVTYTRNVGYLSTMNVVEKCTYKRDWSVKDGETTNLKREAWIDGHIRGVGAVLERFGVERYKHNANQAYKGLSYAVTRLFPVVAAAKLKIQPVAELLTHTTGKVQIPI